MIARQNTFFVSQLYICIFHIFCQQSCCCPELSERKYFGLDNLERSRNLLAQKRQIKSPRLLLCRDRVDSIRQKRSNSGNREQHFRFVHLEQRENAVAAAATAGARGHTRVILFPVQAFSRSAQAEGIQGPAGREIAVENLLLYFYRARKRKKKGEAARKESAIESCGKFAIGDPCPTFVKVNDASGLRASHDCETSSVRPSRNIFNDPGADVWYPVSNAMTWRYHRVFSNTAGIRPT